jgi:ferredoxin
LPLDSTAVFSIEQYLKGEEITGEWFYPTANEVKPPCGVYDYPLRSNRISAGSLSIHRRKGNFDEVDTGYSEKKATQESDRCWHCDLINDFASFNEKCVRCNLCSVVCPTKAIPLSKEVVEGTVRCESCPVGCQIKEGFKGACQRYTNIRGVLQTVEPQVS